MGYADSDLPAAGYVARDKHGPVDQSQTARRPVHASQGERADRRFFIRGDHRLYGRAAGDVRITLIDLSGRSIREISMGEQEEGLHTMTMPLDGLASGCYLCRISTPTENHVVRMIVR